MARYPQASGSEVPVKYRYVCFHPIKASQKRSIKRVSRYFMKSTLIGFRGNYDIT